MWRISVIEIDFSGEKFCLSTSTTVCTFKKVDEKSIPHAILTEYNIDGGLEESASQV